MISSALESIDEGRKSLQSYPTIVHVTVLSAFVLPIAFLPYWAARRHIFALRQRVELLEIGTKHLREKLQVASSVQTLTKDELRRMQSKVQNTIKESHDLQALADQKEVNRTILDETTRTELRRLLQEARRSRYVCQRRVTKNKKRLILILQQHTSCTWGIVSGHCGFY